MELFNEIECLFVIFVVTKSKYLYAFTKILCYFFFAQKTISDLKKTVSDMTLIGYSNEKDKTQCV